MPDRYRAQFVHFVVAVALLLPLTAHAQIENWYQVELIVFSYPAGGTAEQWDATPDLSYPSTTRFLTMPGKQAAAPMQGETASAPAPGQPTPFATLPESQRELGATAMQRSGRYRILFHEAWQQPITNQSASVPIVLDYSGDGGPWPALQGTIKIYLQSDLILETNLWLNTQGEYLQNSWRMPPPPRGPASDVRGLPMQAGPGPQEPAATTVASDSQYPFRHAVLLKQTRHMRSAEVNYIDHPMLAVVAKITPLSATGPEAAAPPETTAQPVATAPAKQETATSPSP